MLTRSQYALFENLKKRINHQYKEQSTQTEFISNKKQKVLEYHDDTSDSSAEYSEYSEDEYDEIILDSDNALVKEINKAINAKLKEKHKQKNTLSFV